MERFTWAYLQRDWADRERMGVLNLRKPVPCAMCGIEYSNHHLTTDGEPVCWSCTGRLEQDFSGAVQFELMLDVAE